MNVVSVGDQARAFALQAASARIKSTISVLADELSTGETADLAVRLKGNMLEIAAIAQRSSVLKQMRSNASEAESHVNGMADAMERVRGLVTEYAESLRLLPLNQTQNMVDMHSREAAATLDLFINTINGSIGGKHLFSGIKSDISPLVPAGKLMDLLETVIEGTSSADEVISAVSNWFDAPPTGSGFLDMAYGGSLGQSQILNIGEGVDISLPITAASAGLRDHLKGLALAALANRGADTMDIYQRRTLLAEAGAIIDRNNASLLGEIGQIGFAQSLISRTKVETDAALTSLEIMQNNIRQADPYATSLALNEAETHLQTRYAVTARLSKLSLVEYLR